MDRNNDGLINFKEFVCSLGLMSVVEPTQRLIMLYILHLPPILPSADLQHNLPSQGSANGSFVLFFFFFLLCGEKYVLTRESVCMAADCGAEEVASDAVEFFEGIVSAYSTPPSSSQSTPTYEKCPSFGRANSSTSGGENFFSFCLEQNTI